MNLLEPFLNLKKGKYITVKVVIINILNMLNLKYCLLCFNEPSVLFLLPIKVMNDVLRYILPFKKKNALFLFQETFNAW